MIVIWGRYRFFPKHVAFRNDFCLRCGEETIALAERTFDVLHFFWLPFLPVGFWRRWFCGECGYKPSHPPRTRKAFKWAGVGILALMAATFWLAPIQEWDPEADPAMIWTMKWASALGLALLVRNILRSPKEVSYRKARRGVEPYVESTCPFCGGLLTLGTERRCDECGLTRE